MEESEKSCLIHKLFAMARRDPKYQELDRRYGEYENALQELSRGLSDDDQDILWGFVCTSDDMNWRMLELICQRFPIDITEV